MISDDDNNNDVMLFSFQSCEKMFSSQENIIVNCVYTAYYLYVIIIEKTVHFKSLNFLQLGVYFLIKYRSEKKIFGCYFNYKLDWN